MPLRPGPPAGASSDDPGERPAHTGFLVAVSGEGRRHQRHHRQNEVGLDVLALLSSDGVQPGEPFSRANIRSIPAAAGGGSTVP